jgi:hypothetical protein
MQIKCLFWLSCCLRVRKLLNTYKNQMINLDVLCEKDLKKNHQFMVALGGLVVIVHRIGHKFACSNPAEDNGILKATKTSSTTSFGGEIKSAVPYRKTLRHVKDPYGMQRNTCRQNSRTFLTKFLLLHY